MRNTALVIDDDVSTLELLRFQLEGAGFDVETAERGGTGLEIVGRKKFDIILTDLNLPDINGIEMVRRCREISPESEIIMVTGHGSTQKAVEATKAGAFYYVEKPVEFDELLVLIEKAIDRGRQAAEIRDLRTRLASRTSYEGIIGGSRGMQDVYEVIESVAGSDANILILGESGTGKEVIANAIHYKSLRAKQPFVKLNCSALPKELIESELFGHRKGAFTGATSDKTGFIGRAEGGSLLLDEIAEMPAVLQPKLLRVLQERVYYQVGSDKPRKADFRLISSTNVDPRSAIAAGNLREDLYYRINTIEIRIPPLRDRLEDVPMLAEHFLRRYAAKYDRDEVRFSERAYDQMLHYNWRGNVRELQNVIERGILLCRDGVINELEIERNLESPAAKETLARAVAGRTAGSLSGAETSRAASTADDDWFSRIARRIVDELPEPRSGEMRDVFSELEKTIVSAALERTGGNKQAAANLLGVYRPRLYGIIKRHEIGDDA